MIKQGVLIVVSGFSGAGKGTVIKELLKKYDYRLSISATTRSPREGEKDGVEYFFISKDKFEDMIKNNMLIEWAEYVGNYYGTPKAYVEEELSKGCNVILEIEIQGALLVKKMFHDALLLFVTPSSVKEIKSRLEKRGTENYNVINERLKKALEESEHMKDYDYIVINDDLEKCVNDISNIINNKNCKVSKNMEFINSIKSEFKNMKLIGE